MSRFDALLKGKKFGTRAAPPAPAPQPSSHTETADTREVAIAEFDAAGQKFEQAEQEDEKLQKELKQLQNVKKFRVWEEDALSGENFKTLRSEVATAEMIAGTAKTILNTTQAIFKALHANSLPSE